MGIKLVGVSLAEPMDRLPPNLQDMFTTKRSKVDKLLAGIWQKLFQWERFLQFFVFFNFYHVMVVCVVHRLSPWMDFH